jgi:hypothetical protein
MDKKTQKKKRKQVKTLKYDAFVMQFGFEYPHKTYQKPHRR